MVETLLTAFALVLISDGLIPVLFVSASYL
jgi:uncharacterized protein YjeT (DUF2065 family)